MTTASAEALRAQILDLVAQYYAVAFPVQDYVLRAISVPVPGKVFDAAEMQYRVDCVATTVQSGKKIS